MPERIVIGLSPETFDRTYESHVITLAGAAVAAMAGFGNDEPALADAALRVALDSFTLMPPEEQAKLQAIADELIECVKTGKRFIGLARFST